jgi:hypothetical protein
MDTEKNDPRSFVTGGSGFLGDTRVRDTVGMHHDIAISAIDRTDASTSIGHECAAYRSLPSSM